MTMEPYNRKFKRFFSDNNKLIYVQLITVININH